VSTPGQGMAPAGVRPVISAAEGSGPGRLRWVSPGPFELAIGDRVAVRENDAEWLGEVVVPPERLVEWPDLTDLPVVVRRVADTEWPTPPVTDGRRLLESLALSPELLARRQPGSVSGPLVARPGSGPGDATEDERGDQEHGGDQRERE
jgi:hypothetical protein